MLLMWLGFFKCFLTLKWVWKIVFNLIFFNGKVKRIEPLNFISVLVHYVFSFPIFSFFLSFPSFTFDLFFASLIVLFCLISRLFAMLMMCFSSCKIEFYTYFVYSFFSPSFDLCCTIVCIIILGDLGLRFLLWWVGSWKESLVTLLIINWKIRPANICFSKFKPTTWGIKRQSSTCNDYYFEFTTISYM